MAFQPVPDAAQVIIESAGGGNTWSNSLWFTRPGFTTVEMEQLAVNVFNAWGLAFTDWLAIGWQTNKVTVYDMRADGAPVRQPIVIPAPGAVVGEVLPLGDAAVLTLYTNTRGRSGRGRLYIGGLNASLMTEQVITNTEYQELAADMAVIVNAGETLGWTHVIVSRWHDGVKRPTAVTFPVTFIVARSNIIGSQDRRNKRP